MDSIHSLKENNKPQRKYGSIYDIEVGTVFKTKDGTLAVLTHSTGEWKTPWISLNLRTNETFSDSCRIGVHLEGFTKEEELLALPYLT